MYFSKKLILFNFSQPISLVFKINFLKSMRISCNFGFLVVRIDYSDQFQRDEVMSLIFSNPLRVNVCVIDYFVKQEAQI